MARTEAPSARSDTGGTDDGRVVEHMIIDDGETSECVLVSSNGDDEALASEWVAANDGAYIALSEMQ